MALSARGDASTCADMAQSEAVTHQHCNSIGCSVYIGRSEAEHTKACTHEVVLAAIVINQSIAMVCAVVLDR